MTRFPKRAHGGTGEDQALTVDVGMLRPPTLLQNEGEGVADTESEHRDEAAENAGADVGRGAAVEVEPAGVARRLISPS